MPPEKARFELPGTERTPHVLLDPEEGLLLVQGCSIPENADRFYTPLHDALDGYLAAPLPRTTIRIELEYFNSSSSKYLLDILKRLDDLHASRASQVTMEWRYAENDLDMQEAGQDYRSLLDLPTRLVMVPDARG
ncbi:MAG: DUF1987 domain-containing protein [Flavobacteriales bacterium]|nr:DUF1987 domain-containing protein [Flavobacteriales bacterium]